MTSPARPALSAALDGCTIVIAVDRRSLELAAALERHGAQVRHAPALTIVPHIDDDALIAATRELIARPPDVVVATTGHDEDTRPQPLALPLAFAACLLMATSFAFGQEAASRIPPLQAASLARAGGAGLGVILLALRPTGIRAALTRWPTLIAMGCLDGMALSSVIAAGSLPEATYASVASSLFGVVTIVMAWAFLKEAVRPLQAAGIALIFTGLARLAWG